MSDVVGPETQRPGPHLGESARDALDQAVLAGEEALAAARPHDDLAAPLASLGRSLLLRYHRRGRPRDLDRAILHLRGAWRRTKRHAPGWGRLCDELAEALATRSARTTADGLQDLTDEIALLSDALFGTPEGSLEAARIRARLGRGFLLRFQRRGSPRDLERAIEELTRAVDRLGDGSEEWTATAAKLVVALVVRYRRTAGAASGPLLDEETYEEIDRMVRRLDPVSRVPNEDWAELVRHLPALKEVTPGYGEHPPPPAAGTAPASRPVRRRPVDDEIAALKDALDVHQEDDLYSA